MSKCIHCNYPYSTASICPNCGSKDPSGIKAGAGALTIVAIIFAVVLFFLSPGIFLTSFIHYFIGLEVNMIWFMAIFLSISLLGYLFMNYRDNVLKYYLLICGGVILIVLLFSLLMPENIFLKTLEDMFNEQTNQQENKSECLRCGGDGNIDEKELKFFLTSDVLTDTPTIKYFQDWMDANHPWWIKKSNRYYNLRKGTIDEPGRHLDGAGYGLFGPQTQKAYFLYKNECFGLAYGTNNCLLCRTK
jgi:hypothetical protein